MLLFCKDILFIGEQCYKICNGGNLLRNILIKVIVCGLFFMLIASGITLGMLEIRNQKVKQNTSYGNESEYPKVGSISFNWAGFLLGRPYITIGYWENRNYSFPIINGSVQLGFNVSCYVHTDGILRPIVHYSFFAGEICDDKGIILGRNSSWITTRSKGIINSNITIFSNSFPADVNSSDNFTIKIVGIGYPPKLSIDWISYPIWISYTEEG
jgi:hypothetical protein